MLREHPLVGQLLDTRRASIITEAELVQLAHAARYVLLGEVHDNPDHHRLQARLVRALGSGRKAVAFEMFDVADQGAIDAHFRKDPKDVAGLGAAVRWEEKGWPAWSLIEPIVQAAIDADMPIVAANLPRQDVMNAARSLSILLDGQNHELPRLPDGLRTDLEEEMFHAHCEHLPRSMMGAMANAQIARDAVMARRLLHADSGQGAILIAGNGHVRSDRGVPWHLRDQAAGDEVVSVGLLEVRESWQDPVLAGREAPYDIVWFTPAWDRGNPCEKLTSRRGNVSW